MTPTQFRKIALSLPDAVESQHMGHPDFRIGGKIFATMGAPAKGWGMVKLTPEQQQAFCQSNADCFQPGNGAWGRQGCTYVRLTKASAAIVRSALQLAVENLTRTPKQTSRRSSNQEPATPSSKPAGVKRSRKQP